METINQRFTLSRVFTWVALGALLLTAIFKILHLPGSSELTLLSFVTLAAALITGSVSGIYLNRDKNGAMRVIAVVVAIILVMIGYTFKILHLSGATQIVVVAVVAMIVTMFINTFHAYNRADSSSLFPYLHEKYTPGIERFLLLLIIPIFFSRMTHIILVFAAGLQMIALMWRYMETNHVYRNMLNFVLVIVASTCLSIPMAGEVIQYEIRLGVVLLFNIAGAILSVRFDQSPKLSSWLVCIPPVMFALTGMVKMGWIASFAGNLPLNIVICSMIGLGIFLSPKYSVMRTFMIMSLAYLLEI